jgi:hypothetical protein
MSILMLPRAPLALTLALALGAAGAADDAQLGPAPRLDTAGAAPAALQPWPVATTAGVPAVVVDPQNRDQVTAIYRGVYLPQGDVAPGWSGGVAGCLAGTTASAYREATIGRVNVYRALAGLPGTVALAGGSQATGTQAAALMFSANRSLSHSPPSSWTCWTQDGASAAGQSNIALGSSSLAAGPAAVDLYMDDAGTGNEAAGHRRWLLYPPQAQMDSGSIPSGSQWAANALWVLSGWGARPPTPNGVAWPPRGYVPWPLLPQRSNRWSFSWPGADFSRATVSMTRNGVPLGAPSYEAITNGYGDNTLVWKPQGVTYAQPAADVTYRVTISGLSGGGAPASLSYDVIVFDPPPLADPLFANGFER